MIALGLETSCDETACGIVRDGKETMANIIFSQINLHAPFGGVVPEIASRAHVENIPKVTRLALEKAGINQKDIDIISVANRPGLIGALLIGLTAAKALSLSWNKPLVTVDHLHAHIIGATLNHHDVQFPAVALVVSGGHTTLLKAESMLDISYLGGTSDDAAGEAFDKVAQILSLGYPGGPAIATEAKKGNPSAVSFPRALLGPKSLNFSFSGIKTAVRYLVLGQQGKPPERNYRVADVAASFQEAVVDTLTEKCRRALEATGFKNLIVGGGVAANERLRKKLKALSKREDFDLTMAKPEFCTDNGAMTAALSFLLYRENIRDNPGKFWDLTVEASAISRLLYGESI